MQLRVISRGPRCAAALAEFSACRLVHASTNAMCTPSSQAKLELCLTLLISCSNTPSSAPDRPATHRPAPRALGACANSMHCAMPVSAPPHTIDSSRVDCTCAGEGVAVS